MTINKFFSICILSCLLSQAFIVAGSVWSSPKIEAKTKSDANTKEKNNGSQWMAEIHKLPKLVNPKTIIIGTATCCVLLYITKQHGPEIYALSSKLLSSK